MSEQLWDDKYVSKIQSALEQAEAKIKDLEAKLEIAVEALKEASEYSNTDDCNGFAGEIAKEALEKIQGEK